MVVDPEKSKELEREAVTLVNQYGWVLPPTVKAFFRKLAVHLGWATLGAALS
jgi:hypothetical protein